MLVDNRTYTHTRTHTYTSSFHNGYKYAALKWDVLVVDKKVACASTWSEPPFCFECLSWSSERRRQRKKYLESTWAHTHICWVAHSLIIFIIANNIISFWPLFKLVAVVENRGLFVVINSHSKWISRFRGKNFLSFSLFLSLYYHSLLVDSIMYYASQLLFSFSVSQ